MTSKQIDAWNVKVAKTLGFKIVPHKVTLTSGEIFEGFTLEGPFGRLDRCWGSHEYAWREGLGRNYVESLDACREFEDRLSPAQWSSYRQHLENIVKHDATGRSDVAVATPLQRCRALTLAVIYTPTPEPK